MKFYRFNFSCLYLCSSVKEIDDKNIRFELPNAITILVRLGDLLAEQCDAIVNSTNSSMKPNGGLDLLIHQHFGYYYSDQVQATQNARQSSSCAVGQSRIFLARFERLGGEPFFIINTVTPTYQSMNRIESEKLLETCFYTVFVLANLYQINSIAFPAIACGSQKYPCREFAKVAIEAVQQYALGVLDVRFVINQKTVFHEFVDELKRYTKNVDAPVSPMVLPPIEAFSNTVACPICRSLDQTSNKDLRVCSSCDMMTRSSVFEKMLYRLAAVGMRSFSHLIQESRVLRHFLEKWPLFYEPAVKYESFSRPIDQIAEYFLENYCDSSFRKMKPIQVLADGDCLYNSFISIRDTVDPLVIVHCTPCELRVRNIIELVENHEQYKKVYRDIVPSLDNLETYVSKEMVYRASYAAVWDLLSIATVLNIQICLVYPKVNGPEDAFYKWYNGRLLKPLVAGGLSTDDKLKKVMIMFTACERKGSSIIEQWTPNHFVPLLPM